MPTSQQLSADELKNSVSRFDSALDSSPDPTSTSFFKSNKHSISKNKSDISPDDIISALNSSDSTESRIYEMLQNIPPLKYLQFYENSKPPYIGTWCSNEHKRIRFPVLEPFNSEATGYDYNYDSDLDWNGEEEGDGEDIDDDEDDEDDDEMNELEDEDDDMNDFVEGNNDSKRLKKFLGPLIPICQWNESSLTNSTFDDMKYERLHMNINFSVDPFFNYWGNNNNPMGASGKHSTAKTHQTTSGKNTSPVINGTPNLLTPQKPTIKDQKVIYDLINFIEKNKNYSLGTLTELSKNEESFKSFTKSLLKHTIQEIASYNKSTSHWEVKLDTKESLAKIYG